MGHSGLKDSNLVVDLESGGTAREKEGNSNPTSSGIPAKKTLGRVWSGFVGIDGCVMSGDSLSTCKDELNYGEVSGNGKELLASGLGKENVGFAEKKMVKEKRKKIGSKKPPKPPRPPRGPSLDAADMKLVREISELAMMKRARVERMKGLKMKADKVSSSSSGLIAMIITVLFCFVLIFQGICSRNNLNMGFYGSPETAGDALIHVEHSPNLPTTDIGGPGSGFPSSAESAPLEAAALQDGRKEFPGK